MARRKKSSFQYYEGIGRRKEAVARVRLYLVGKDSGVKVNKVKIKKGEIFVNWKPIESVFPSLVEKKSYLLPLELTNNQDRFAVSIVVKGGGKKGQLGAIIHGLARAVEKVDRDQYRPILKKNGFLTRDPRVKERRKVGRGGKARRKKQSPKR